MFKRIEEYLKMDLESLLKSPGINLSFQEISFIEGPHGRISQYYPPREDMGNTGHTGHTGMDLESTQECEECTKYHEHLRHNRRSCQTCQDYENHQNNNSQRVPGLILKIDYKNSTNSEVLTHIYSLIPEEKFLYKMAPFMYKRKRDMDPTFQSQLEELQAEWDKVYPEKRQEYEQIMELMEKVEKYIEEKDGYIEDYYIPEPKQKVKIPEEWYAYEYFGSLEIKYAKESSFGLKIQGLNIPSHP